MGAIQMKRPLTWVLVSAVLMLSVTAAVALDLGQVLKVLAIGTVVSEYGDEMNKVINGALKEHEAQAMGATKVVPILSLGRGVFIGAAQVVGVPENVRVVQAVVQIETKLGGVSGTLLVPTSTRKPASRSQAASVPNVGVSAVIDIKASSL